MRLAMGEVARFIYEDVEREIGLVRPECGASQEKWKEYDVKRIQMMKALREREETFAKWLYLKFKSENG